MPAEETKHAEYKPMIENSDRGLTINKQLGWTVLVAIVGLVFYMGTTIASLQSAVVVLNTSVVAQKADVTLLEARVRVLENQAGRFEEKLQSILTIVSRVDRKLEGNP